MKNQLKLLSVTFLISLSTTTFSQSVGIGTETPNSNAILELVAPDNNQGLLVPRMTTLERTATSFTSNLSASENGLMVYDEDMNKFFFWINDQWIELATGNLSGLPDQVGQAGKVLSTNGSTAIWSEFDFNSLANVPSGLVDGDDNTQLSDIDISDLGYIKNADDADSDPSNEFQDLTLDGSTLSLTNSTESIDLSPFSGTDTDDQTLKLTGTELSISEGNSIDISSINTNLSETEVDNFTSNNGYLTIETDGSVTNEVNTGMSLTGTTINVTDANSTQSVDIGGTFATDAELTASDNADGDKDDSNEIQDISTNGTAGDISLSDGSTLSLNVDDADSDSTNELQNLSLSDGTLSLSNSSTTVDLSPFSGTNTDNQTISLSGNDLSISGGNTIDISAIDTNLSEVEVDGFVNNNGYLTSEVDGSINNEVNTGMSLSGTTIQVTDAGGTQGVNIGDTFATDAELATSDASDGDKDDSNEIQDISTSGGAGNISLSDGSTINLNVNDADASTTNELNTGMSLSGTTIQVTDAGGTESVNIGGTFATDAELTASDAADGDKSASNEIQDISTTGVAGNISLSDGSTINLNVNDADASTTNELNTGMSLSGTTIQVTDAGGTESVNIGGTFATDAELTASDAADGDKSASNEIQTVTKVGTTVTLSNSGGSFSVADNDNSSSNEFNSGMSISGTSIRVTDGGGTQSVNIGGTFATDSELDSRTFIPEAFKATPKAGGGSIPVGSSVLNFDTEVYDINGSYDGSSTFDVKNDGLYNLGGQFIFQNTPTGLLQILLVDASMNVLYSKAYAPGSVESSISFSADLSLKAGDAIRVMISNTTLGGNEANAITIGSTTDETNFFFCGKRFN